MTDAPPVPAPVPVGPRRPWLGLALVASLAVNLAVLGLVAGLAFKGPPDRPGRELGLWRYGAALPPPYRDELMRSLREGRQNWRSTRDRLAGQRQAFAAALTATPYDRGAVETILASERRLLDALGARGAALLIEQIDRMDAEDRAVYAARLLAPPRRKSDGRGPPQERRD